MFTIGTAGLPGVQHIDGYDFTPVIEKALSLPRLAENPGETKLLTGFSDTNILPLADKLIAAIKAGKIRHFFLVGGCDAPGQNREYYREFVKNAPSDTIILTLACGKFRLTIWILGPSTASPVSWTLGSATTRCQRFASPGPWLRHSSAPSMTCR
jgi:hydroxylamine reductase